MHIQSTPIVQQGFPLKQLEQIESVIPVLQEMLVTFQGWRDSLHAELDTITRPQPVASRPAIATVGPGLEYRGTFTPHWSYIDIHIDLLRRLWIDFPDRREAMGKAVGRCGTSRAYVAKSYEELFPGQPTYWARRYSRVLVEGWYVDTNLNRERMRRILPVAVEAAGLSWSKDAKAYWKRTQVGA